MSERGMPSCTSQHWPHQGGFDNAGAAMEAEGMPGDKEAMPSVMQANPSDTGNTNEAVISGHAASHSWPTSGPTPDNVEGSITPGNPTAAEGALPMAEYPHAGPPTRTVTIAGAGNPGMEY